MTEPQPPGLNLDRASVNQALDTLDLQSTGAAPTTATGAVILAALQASPYPDIDLLQPGVRLSNVRDVVL